MSTSKRTTTNRITKKYKEAELTKSAATAKRATPAQAKKASISSAPASTRSKGAKVGPTLDVNSTDYDGLFKEARAAMGRKPIHAEDKNRIDHILRIFDFNPDFGPCVGMSRMERWERADEMDLNPPIEIKEILLTQQGQTEDRYAQTVLHNYDL